MTRGKISGYYVNSILAKREAKADGYDEAILLDTEGYVSEGTGENIFIVRRPIKTTPLTSILEGITRNAVIELAREQGIVVVEERFTRDEMHRRRSVCDGYGCRTDSSQRNRQSPDRDREAGRRDGRIAKRFSRSCGRRSLA